MMRPIAVLALYSAILGYNWVVMKHALLDASPFAFAALRAGSAGLTLFIVLPALGRSIRPRRMGWTLAVGLFQTTGVIGFVFWALANGSAGRTAVLMYTMPFWAALLGWAFMGERLSGLRWLALGVGVTGLLLIFEPWSDTGAWTGRVLAVLAGMANAGSIVVMKRMRQSGPVDMFSLTAWQTALGSLPLIAVALLVPGQHLHWTPYLIGAVGYNGILATALAWVLWTWLVHRLPAGTLGMGTLAIPVIGLTAATLQLHEVLRLWEGVGMALILLGLATYMLAPLRPKGEASARAG
jgi:drug/metabolite transporter (DMT)-like permease